MLRCLILFVSLIFISIHVNAQLMINEFSTGPANTEQEYYELIVEGPPGTHQDIRNWILDDHGGHFGCGANNGLSVGHVRFAQIAQWSCLPVGTIIVIYNPNDPHPLLPPDDLNDSNSDGVYILPITASSVLDIHKNAPSLLNCNNYALGNFGSSPMNWNVIDLDSIGDVASIIDPSLYVTPAHEVGYGSLLGPLSWNHFSGVNGGSTNFSFENIVSNDFALHANWVASAAVGSDSPGVYNNTSNQNWIDSLKHPIIADITVGCVPMTVNFSTSSSSGTHTYNWDFGDGNQASGSASTHVFNSVGVYSVVLDIIHPNGCSTSDTVEITVNPAVVSTFNALPDVCETASSFVLSGASPGGGMYSGVGVTNNVFDPAIAGPGTHTITYTITGVCPAVSTQTLIVEPEPIISITPVTNLCETGTSVQLSATPIGGVFTGGGVVGSSFDPIIVGAGSHDVIYNISGTCIASDTLSVQVDSVPNVSISAIPSTCTSSAPINLMGIPAGGVFSGIGVVGTTFSPSNANLGSNTIQYSVTNGACIGNANTVAQVLSVPVVTLNNFPDQCISATPFNLTGGSPSGGNYSGLGVVSNQFDPSLATAGTHFVNYTYSNGVCSSTASANVTVVPIPNVQFSIPSVECVSASNIQLSNGTPTGGVYSGNGVTGSSFSPTNAGIGTHSIIYTVNNTCIASDTQTISIQNTPQATLTNIASVCEDGVAVTLSNGFPTGGVL